MSRSKHLLGVGLAVLLAGSLPGWTGAPAASAAETYVERDTVMVRAVVAPEPGWVVIHQDAQGELGAVLGETPVPAGMTDNVVVALDQAVAADAPVWAAFYGDHGQPNQLEIGGADTLLALGYGAAMQPLVLGLQMAAPTLQEGSDNQDQAGQDQTGQDQGDQIQGDPDQGDQPGSEAQPGQDAGPQGQGLGEMFAGQLSPLDDQPFLEQAITAGLAEVMTAQLALERAEDGNVRAFAVRMIQEHSQANDQLAALAQQFSVQPPQDTDEPHRQMFQQLSELSGSEFDRLYMQSQVEDHRAAVELFTQKAQGESEVAQFAAQTLPTLQEHFDLALQIHASLGGEEAQAQAAQQNQSSQQDQGQGQPASLPVTGAGSGAHPLVWFSGGFAFLLLAAGERLLRRMKR